MTSVPSTLGIVASGQSVLAEAVFWLDARSSVNAEQVMVNRGTGGAALNATYGSAAGVDTNDPQFLPHTGTNYLYLPGVTGNAQGAHSAAMNLAGDQEIVFRCQPFALGTSVGLVTRTNSYRVLCDGTDSSKLQFGLYNGASVTQGSSATGILIAGTTRWYKVTRATSTGLVSFFWAPDQPTEPTVWTAAGTATVLAGQAVISATTATEIGSRDNNTGGFLQGAFYRAIIRDGVAGTTVFDADFTTGITSGAQASFTATTGQTVTINRATSGRKAVAVVQPVLLFGTNDYLEVADNDLLDFSAADSFTVLTVVRQWATPVTGGAHIGKRNTAGTGPRWGMISGPTNTPSIVFHDGTTSGQAGGPAAVTLGTLAVFAGVVDRSTQRNTAYANNTAGTPINIAAIGSVANALPLRIGVVSDAVAGINDMELVAAAVWRRALTANEIATIAAAYA